MARLKASTAASAPMSPRMARAGAQTGFVTSGASATMRSERRKAKRDKVP